MDQPKFVISAAEAESMAESHGLPSVLHLLAALVSPARSLARPPISGFQVAAVGLAADGRIFAGVNLEFPGLPLNQSVHAEQFLLTNAAVHGAAALVAVAVSAAPCGHCRQFLQELRHSAALKILITTSGEQNHSLPFKPLSEFLTSPFGPTDLLQKDSPLLLEPHHNSLSCGGDSGENSVKSAALAAAVNSHAPYSGCPSGIAVIDRDGRIYRGSYAESAAYNPSLPPLQAALVAYIAGGGGGYERIVGAALVEKAGGKVRQEDISRLMLKVISPKCKFEVFHCHSVENGFTEVSD